MQPRRTINTDFLKTAGAILLVGIIVVATFIYGNSQRQEQLKRDNTAKKQQEQRQLSDKSAPVTSTTELPAASSKPSATVTPKSSPSATPQTATPTPQSVGGGTLPNNSGAATDTIPTTTPQTGPETAYLLPIALMAGLVQLARASRRNLRNSLLR